jgi:glutamine synthetase
MLDYDKKFLLESLGNLTFDGSSIRGFTPQHESDLRPVDWSSIRYFPPTRYWAEGDLLRPF